MKHTITLALGIAYHRHFVEAVRRAVRLLGGCPVGRAIAAGGVAFTLLRSGLGAGQRADPGHATPGRVAVATVPVANGTRSKRETYQQAVTIRS